MRGETPRERGRPCRVGRCGVVAIAASAAIAAGACGGIASEPPPDPDADTAADAADAADAAHVADATEAGPDAGYGSRCVSALAQTSCIDPVTGGETFDWFGPDGGSHGCGDPGFPCPVGDTCKPFQATWTGTCEP